MNMLQILQKIDDFLFDHIFQKFADWFQIETGKSCFFLARILCWGLIVFETAKLVFTYTSTRVVILPIEIFLLLSVITMYQKMEKISYRNPNTMNPGRIDMTNFAVRLSFIIVFLYLLIEHLVWGSLDKSLMLLFGCLIMYLYFISCTPKPPSLFKKLSPILETN